jgi:hypothetical protein
MTDTPDTADRLAMYLGGGLIVLAIPVVGIINTLTGSMTPLYVYEGTEASGQAYSAAAVPQGAEVVSAPLVDPNVRAGMVALGLAIWGLFAVYRLVAGDGATTDRRTTTAGTAD